MPPPPTVPVPASIRDIAAVELRRVCLTLIEPFVAAHGTERNREVVLVHVIGGDGRHGWGECVALSAPTYSKESTATAWQVLRDELVPGLFVGAARSVRAYPMAWTAVETALVDLKLRGAGQSLVEALGAHPRPLDASAVVGMQRDPDATVEVVAQRVAEGYRSVKVKIEPGRDLDRLQAVREAFPDLGLAADGNGSYTVQDRSQLERLAALDLALLEQPLAAGDLAGLADLRANLGVPVALDESVASLDDLDRAIAAGAGTVLNLKPGRVGGIAAAVALAERAREAGWDVFVGGMLETGVGRAVGLAVASLDACTLPTDLGPSTRYFAEDVTAPIRLLADGRIQVPDGPGIGIVPRGVRLDVVTEDRVVLTP